MTFASAILAIVSNCLMVAYLAMLVGSFLQSPKILQIHKNFLSLSLNIWNVSFKCKPLVIQKGFCQEKKIEDG